MENGAFAPIQRSQKALSWSKGLRKQPILALAAIVSTVQFWYRAFRQI